MSDKSIKTATKKQPGMGEFVALMAFSMALVALSIDAMLPAFPLIISDLQVDNANDIQLIISFLFVGLAIGQFFYGPLSDSIGRKPAIFLGFILFIAGTVMSMLSTDFNLMLVGRFLAGIGAAGPRVVAVALIRDRYKGSEMARVMSFIMTVFILVPVFAPALGQFILMFAGWRTIFGVLIVLTIMTLVWLAIRQPETLPKYQRMPFTFRKVKTSFAVVFSNRVTMVATLVAGFISGTFFGYLNVCQKVFQDQYELGALFPFYFAFLAIGVGCASLLNSGLVLRFGMHHLSSLALTVLMFLSWIFLLLVWLHNGQPPLWMFMSICFALFFAIGVLFGNLNAIAMEPLGHVAGTGAAVIGSLTSILAVVLGYFLGDAYNGTLFPMATGFAVLSTLSLLSIQSVKSSWNEQPED